MLIVDADSVVLERLLLTGELAGLLVGVCCGRGATLVGGFHAGRRTVFGIGLAGRAAGVARRPMCC